MAFGLKGGVPRILNGTVGTAGEMRSLPFPTNHLQFRNEGANSIKFYLSEADFTNNANFVTIASSAELEGPMNIRNFWIKSSASTSAWSAIVYQRL